jgi:hypothetical protein
MVLDAKRLLRYFSIEVATITANVEVFQDKEEEDY